MAKTDLIRKEKVRAMRRAGHSINEIVEATGTNKTTVSVWLRDLPLTDEQRAALARENPRWANAYQGGQANRRKGLTARKAAQESGREQARLADLLHRKGCILYWAEGAKQKSAVHIINSDPDVVLFFTRFLRDALHVKSEAITIYVHCNTQDELEHTRIKQYWLGLLDLPDLCFKKIILKQGSKFTHTQDDVGLCTVMVRNTHLVMHIFGAIQEYTGIDNPAWLF